ncbi:hypothetical protein [Crateriforma conspicua]|uniref:Uncharacterized protein n=1 Tax=Crateriforma conspicua TaxID=2527996 RepID=A0A5C5Y4Q8_9PLAN|nr:hypothetical protein [Crateriforma conspicua]TWT70716.1 hypothetical protein Pan14r_30230 [Crateriforma conspicua]
MNQTRPVWSTPWLWISIAAVLLIGLAVSFWPSTTPLSDDGYDLTMALYNACNRRSEVAIEQLQDQVETKASAGQLSTDATSALRSVIDDAKAGRWQPAMVRCRELMDDQIKH